MKKIATLILGMAASLPMMAQTAANDTVKAQFPGGVEEMNRYIEANRKYPAVSLSNGIEGIVDVSFIVKTDGNREQYSIVRLVDPDLESEAIRVVKGMPAWIPASAGGKPIDSKASVRIPFILPE